MNQVRSEGIGFFDVIADKQTYLNLTYLTLSFPLGIFYFVFIVASISLGIALIPIFIGIPLLYVFMISLKLLMKFERKMAALFLGIGSLHIFNKSAYFMGRLLKIMSPAQVKD